MPRLDPDKLVFMDETGATTKMGRLLQPIQTQPALERQSRTATGSSPLCAARP
jgi:hypothetical protein